MKKNRVISGLFLLFFLSSLLMLSACQPQASPPAPNPIIKEDEECWNTKELSWEKVRSASGVKAYYLRLAYEESGGQFKEAKEFGPIEKTSYEMPVDCGNVFRWSVRVVNENGVSSEWSDWVVDDSGVPPG